MDVQIVAQKTRQGDESHSQKSGTSVFVQNFFFYLTVKIFKFQIKALKNMLILEGFRFSSTKAGCELKNGIIWEFSQAIQKVIFLRKIKLFLIALNAK